MEILKGLKFVITILIAATLWYATKNFNDEAHAANIERLEIRMTSAENAIITNQVETLKMLNKINSRIGYIKGASDAIYRKLDSDEE